MKRWFVVILLSSLVFVACCSTPAVSYAPTTAFIATVISQEQGQTLVHLDTGQTLELSGLSELSTGQRLYIQGTLLDEGILINSFHLL